MRRQQKWYGMLPYAWVLALVVVAADQWSKEWLLYDWGLAHGRAYEITSFFNLVMVWNHGVSFGLFASGSNHARYTLLAIAALIVLVLSWSLMRVFTRFLATGIGLVIGGAVGNMVDRVQYGAVADFFDVHLAGYHWPAFNVADACICTGVAMMLVDSIFLEKKRKRMVF